MRKGLASSGRNNGVQLMPIVYSANYTPNPWDGPYCISPIDKSPYSPDLNPIEQLWDYMKDWIGDRYLVAQDRKLSYDQPHEAVRAAWDAILTSILDKQIDLMQARCKAVIDAQGGQPPY
ncbi:transposable element tc3 transposase [Penicillium diatomitis]|uniref:Transposable element tc3 transposase n=1 Tax=Penicillium diatomitis TaxID=2819901 RepID=A0A9W9WRE0_9EURO|nr:transposable element tc3 transposase [Penicillium diatomitis]KAJ5471933.1 transposable element tc3 transposase [Penicillium diatomitis]